MRKTWKLMLAAAALIALGSLAQRPAAAQSGGTVGGSQAQGMFGSRDLGLSQGTVPGSSGRASGTGFGSGITAGQGGSAGGATGQRGATGFVGADSSDVVNLRSQQGTTGAARRTSTTQGLQNIFQQFSQGNFNDQQRAQQSRAQPNIRISLNLGFQPAPASPARMEAFGQRLMKLPGIRFVGPVESELVGRTAVLRGTVVSEADRELAEALALMEPDVRDVRNELVVDPSAATAEELPPASATPQ
jgi:hypothetical protein